MPLFQYTARSQAGARIEGTIEAVDRRAALAAVERTGAVPIAVVEAAGPAPAAARKHAPAAAKATPRRGARPAAARPGARPRMRQRDMLLFTRELADLLASGMKLGHALNTLARRGKGEEENPLIARLRDEIVQGVSLSDTLAKFPETFPPLFVSMIKAGEASGALSEVLQRLVIHFERIQEVKEKVVTAMVYPMIVLAMGIGTLVFSMVFVVPRFSVIFEELETTLPLATRILIGASQALTRYGLFVVGALVIAGVLFRRALHTARGRLWWHRLQLRLPLVRGIVQANAYSQFARTLSTLLANGVPVLQALGIVERVIGNEVIAREIHNARDRVTDGTTISRPLAAGKVFPPLITDMLAVGEQTGDVSASLSHIARRYESELDRSVKVSTTALEPIMIVAIAILVGFVAISMLMAVFDLTSGLNV